MVEQDGHTVPEIRAVMSTYILAAHWMKYSDKGTGGYSQCIMYMNVVVAPCHARSRCLLPIFPPLLFFLEPASNSSMSSQNIVYAFTPTSIPPQTWAILVCEEESNCPLSGLCCGNIQIKRHYNKLRPLQPRQGQGNLDK